jgi:predicted nucleic acid-binding protein
LRIAFDTNILIYAEGTNGEHLRQAAWNVIARVRSETLIVPAQALGELFNVLERKAKYSREAARKAMLDWADLFIVVDTTSDILQSAADLAVEHRLQIWDAVILSAASQADCRLLLSEDMQDGFTWGGVTIVNPFAEKPNPLLAALLEPPAS